MSERKSLGKETAMTNFENINKYGFDVISIKQSAEKKSYCIAEIETADGSKVEITRRCYSNGKF